MARYQILGAFALFAWVLLASPSLAQQSRELWVARHDGPVSGNDSAAAIAVDSSGNSYVAGQICIDINPLGQCSTDWETVKYDTAGNALWATSFAGVSTFQNSPSAIAVDVSGNVYVAGAICTGAAYDEVGGATCTYSDYATIKYDPNGVQLWVARYNGTGFGPDGAAAVAVDSSGNVYVTGTSYGADSLPHYATLKYDSNGNTIWVARYNGPGNGSDYAQAIGVDSSGNVYITGGSTGVSTSLDYATIKYDSAGNQLWVARYDGPASGNDFAVALAVGTSGNVYVTGSSGGIGTSDDYATIKYDSTGNQLWLARYDGPAHGTDQPAAIALGPNENVHVTGASTGTNTSSDYATVQYDSNGNQIWVARYVGPAGGYDAATSIAVDGVGRVNVTGHSVGIGTGYDYATIQYSPQGATNWVDRYDGPSHSDDWGVALAVDPSGNVYVTGTSLAPVTNNDWATLKLSAVAPAATLSPTSFDFGNQTITGQGPTTTFVLTAEQDIQITSVTTGSSEYIVGSQCPAALAASGTCTITVTFQPGALGVSRANLTVTGSFGSSLVATLSGNSQAAILSASVSGLNFGRQQVNTSSAPQAVTLTNTGNIPLQITSIATSTDYAQTNNCGTSLAPNATCSLSVTFTPSAVGNRSGQISFATNSIGGISAVSVSGTGQAAVLSVSPNSVSFANQLLNTTSPAQVIAVSNSGNTTVQITGITTTGDFTQTNNCGAAVAPNSVCNVYVTFTPSASGTRTGSLTVNANTIGAQLIVSLAGTGVYPAMSESPHSLSFGNQIVGSSSVPQTVILSNTGTAPLQFNTIYTTGDFSETTGCSSPLVPGTRCSISIVFTPTARYARTGTLVISSSQISQTDTVTLSGTGTVAIAQLSPGSLSFGNQRVNTSSASQSVTLLNTGDEPLILSTIFTTRPYSQTNTCGTSIAPGTGCNIAVVFSPTVRGTVNGALSITGNEQGTAPVTALSGTGVGTGH
jgi:hypothetical protein